MKHLLLYSLLGHMNGNDKVQAPLIYGFNAQSILDFTKNLKQINPLTTYFTLSLTASLKLSLQVNPLGN